MCCMMLEDIMTKKVEIAAMSELVTHSRDIEARAKILAKKAQELPAASKEKQITLAQSAVVSALADVRKAEEVHTQHVTELEKEREDMKNFLQQAQQSKEVLQANHLKKRERDLGSVSINAASGGSGAVAEATVVA